MYTQSQEVNQHKAVQDNVDPEFKNVKASRLIYIRYITVRDHGRESTRCIIVVNMWTAEYTQRFGQMFLYQSQIDHQPCVTPQSRNGSSPSPSYLAGDTFTCIECQA